MDSEALIAIFGTASRPAPAERIGIAGLSLDIEQGAPRAITFAGIEVLRRIDYPIRDTDWGTLTVTETAQTLDAAADRFVYSRSFETTDGHFSGVFLLQGDAEPHSASLHASLQLTAAQDMEVNRAGLTLLHPISGVPGTPLEVLHPDGSQTRTTFPGAISPGQPAFDIVGLDHRMGPVAIRLRMEGEVFEMEDQRNWTDASYKTYCRPLGAPRPFVIRAGETVAQAVTLTVTADARGETARAPASTRQMARMPEIWLAQETAVAPLPPAISGAIGSLGAAGVQLRLAAGDPIRPLPPGLAQAAALEIVLEPDVPPGPALAQLEAASSAAGIAPARVTALTRPYLASHQPQGPWPEGPTPQALVPDLRRVFPQAEIGGGVLTNFTEFNRCPPVPEDIDFATFGTCAIVHAADDRSVLETLEALPDVFASAAALAPGRPLHLGLISIGMRSNPYGAALAANPNRTRVPMAMDDPRHGALFGAAWMVAAAAAAARGGVASFAPAMTGGPLGLGHQDGGLFPLYHVVRVLGLMAGRDAEASGGAGGIVLLRCDAPDARIGLAANLGDTPMQFAAPDGLRLRHLGVASAPLAARDPDWILRAPVAGTAILAPMELVVMSDARPAA